MRTKSQGILFSSFDKSEQVVTKKNIIKAYGAYLIFFVLFFCYYAIIGRKEAIPSYLLILQLYYFITYSISFFLILCTNVTLNVLYVHIFLYSLVSATCLRIISWEFLNEAFLLGVDSKTYDLYATQAYWSGQSLPGYLSRILETNVFKFDDLGMFIIVYYIYGWFGPFIGQNVLIILNAVVITWSMVNMNKLLLLFDHDLLIRKFCIILLGCFPFLSLTAGVGLKENFFILILISGFYHVLYYQRYGGVKHLVCSIVYLLMTLGFRLATFVMLLTSYAVAFIANRKNRKLLIYLCIILSFLGGILVNIAIGLLYGGSLETVMRTTDYRTQSMDSISSSSKWIVQGLAIFIGPYPNFSRASEYAIAHSSGIMMKVVLGFFLIKGIWNVLKNFDWRYYSLVIYLVLNLLMLVIAGVALDMRYQIPLFPLTLPLICKAMQMSTCKVSFFVFCSMIVILVGLYNQR